MKVIAQYLVNAFNAGPKAKKDIEKILKEKKGFKVKSLGIKDKDLSSKLNLFFYKIKKHLFMTLNLNKNEITVIQFPFVNDIINKSKLKNKIVFIHDIEGLRQQDDKILRKEIFFLSTCKYIISHNNSMKNFLVTKGIDEKKIYVLEMFDYLTGESNFSKAKRKIEKSNLKVIYAGNLSREKTPFIYQIDTSKIEFELNLYGIGIESDVDDRIKYRGSEDPDKLPLVLDGDLGLVWDGNFDSSDENLGFKNYTKYNNPHKISCYIAAGLPVIVWNKSAISEFVKKYNIGYTIDNIYDINDIDLKDYCVKKENVAKISENVRSGYYTIKILNDILSDIKGETKC